MKVLLINGSPRANGNTARALKEVGMASATLTFFAKFSILPTLLLEKL